MCCEQHGTVKPDYIDQCVGIIRNFQKYQINNAGQIACSVHILKFNLIFNSLTSMGEFLKEFGRNGWITFKYNFYIAI